MSWWSAPNSRHAFLLACASMISTIAASILGLSLYWISDSPLCLVYGLENCVDLISDMIVVWRFYCPADTNPEVEDLLLKREKRASIAISAVLALLGIDIIITAIIDLGKGEERLEDSGVVIVLSAISFVIFGILTIFKLHYAMALESSSLQKDGICSLIGTILSLGLLADALISRKFPSAWWFDPIVALACGIAAFIIGMQAVIVARFVHKLPIFRPSWWLVSQGDVSGTPQNDDKGSFAMTNGDGTLARGDLEMQPATVTTPSTLV